MTDKEFQRFLKLRNLLAIDGIGSTRILKLLQGFGSINDIYSADRSEIAKITSFNLTIASRIIESKNNINMLTQSLGEEVLRLEKMGAKIITYWDDSYPEILRNIYLPPLIIYVLGELQPSDKNSIAVVGTRRPTDYGKMLCSKFSSELARQNITIVSGLARGIDSIAHRSAIKAGGRTIAVIGSGLDIVYPPENKALYNDIKNNGLIISEFELGTKPDAQNFPKRNRIISGMSIGTLVIESKGNGGAMQTANYAVDQNREVFAIPGNLTVPESEGTNELIKINVAKLVKNPDDILIDLNLKIKPKAGKNFSRDTIDISLFEKKVLDNLNESPKHIDIVAKDSSLSTSECLVNLLSLEFKGMVQQLPGKMFRMI